MKLSSFLTAVGFLTLSVAVPAPTPTNPTPGAVDAVMPEPTLVPRYDADAICNKLRAGNYREWRVPDEWTRHLMPRMSPEEIEFFCNHLQQGNLKEGNIEVSTIGS